MRSFFFLVFLLVVTPICFFRPYVGIYVWYWLAFMNPHRLTWGMAHTFSVALMVGVATLAGSVAYGSFRRPPKGNEVPLMMVLFGFMTLSTFVAMYPDSAWIKWQQVMKIMLMTVLTTYLIDSKQKLRVLLLVISLSIGFFAVKAVPWALATGGQYMITGPPESSIESNNDIAMAFNMVLPLLAFFSFSEPRRIVRWMFRGVFFVTIAGVFLSYSRGAFLGLCAVGIMLILRSRYRFGTIVVIVFVAALAAALLPSKWAERMQTIETYEQDQSAMERIATWTFAWNVATERPLTGGGFQAFRANPLGFDSHSNYFGILAEHGFLALGVYMLLIGSTFFTNGKIRRMTRKRPDLAWYHNCAGALQVSIVAYMVNGLTLGHQYFDLFYALVAATVILRTTLLAEERAREAAAATPASVAVPLDPLPRPL